MKSRPPVFRDRNALAADAVVAVNRIKPHTDFTGLIESGIIKMLVIGLGKRKSRIRSGTRWVAGDEFALTRIGEGGARENAFCPWCRGDRCCRADGPRASDRAGRNCLSLSRASLQAKEWLGRLPFDEAEISLIIGELGKSYSGAGLDPNVIGRRMVETEADYPSPRIVRLAVLDQAP